MILSAIAERLKRRSKDDSKGRHFEASLIVQAAQGSAQAHSADEATESRVLIARLKAAEARIADKDATISEQCAALDDLRRRLDSAEEERRRLTLMLADQRPARLFSRISRSTAALLRWRDILPPRQTPAVAPRRLAIVLQPGPLDRASPTSRAEIVRLRGVPINRRVGE